MRFIKISDNSVLQLLHLKLLIVLQPSVCLSGMLSGIYHQILPMQQIGNRLNICLKYYKFTKNQCAAKQCLKCLGAVHSMNLRNLRLYSLRVWLISEIMWPLDIHERDRNFFSVIFSFPLPASKYSEYTLKNVQVAVLRILRCDFTLKCN